jgi:5-methylcytosine-specific restriction endonuclease McrA
VSVYWLFRVSGTSSIPNERGLAAVIGTCATARLESRRPRREYHRDYYQKNKAAWAERRSVPGFEARQSRRRRARLRNGHVEDVESLVVLELDDGVCGICGEDVDPFDFQVDHVVPLSRGGENSYANTQVAHALCNQRKGPRLMEAA